VLIARLTNGDLQARPSGGDCRENGGPHAARVDGQNRVRYQSRLARQRPLPLQMTRTRARQSRMFVEIAPQVMGHTKVDTTMSVYTQVLDGAARLAADRVGSELFRVVQIPDGTTTPTH